MRSLLLPLFLLSLLVCSCSDRPDGVPSKGTMEDLLYDYHRAQALLEVASDEGGVDGEEYIMGVLDKYGMDSEMFDSAMIWYASNPDQLKDIYQNVEKRLKAEDEEMQAKVGSSEMTAVYSDGGDTTNLWNGARLIVLRPQQLHCLEQFTLKADTSYRRTDHFILNADVKFIKEDRSIQTILYMCLSIKTKEGKVFSKICEPHSSSIQQLDVSQASESDIAEVSGFFYYKPEKTSKSICLINGISLIRMHIQENTDTTGVASLASDSMVIDSLPQMQDSPDIPSIELSDSAPSGTQTPRKQIERRNEVEDIKIRRAPLEMHKNTPTQRRQSIQQGRGQNGSTAPRRPANRQRR